MRSYKKAELEVLIIELQRTFPRGGLFSRRRPEQHPEQHLIDRLIALRYETLDARTDLSKGILAAILAWGDEHTPFGSLAAESKKVLAPSIRFSALYGILDVPLKTALKSFYDHIMLSVKIPSTVKIVKKAAAAGARDRRGECEI